MLNSNDIAKGIVKSVVLLFLLFLLFYALWIIRVVFVYIAFAAILTLISKPIRGFMQYYLKFSIRCATIVTIFLFLTAFIGLVMLLSPLFLEHADLLSQIDFSKVEKLVSTRIRKINSFFIQRNIYFFNDFLKPDIISKFDLGRVTTSINSIFNSIGNIAMAGFSILFITYFFMADSKNVVNFLTMSFPSGQSKRVVRVLKTTEQYLSRYFLGLCIQWGILFFLYSIVLYSFGIKNVLSISIICAFLNLIPYVGPLMGMLVFWVFSASSMFSKWLDFSTQILPNLFYISLFYLSIQAIDNFLIQPLIFSKSVKSHPLEIFLVILIGGLLYGIIGAAIAVPVYTGLKIILKEFFSEFQFVQFITRNVKIRS